MGTSYHFYTTCTLWFATIVMLEYLRLSQVNRLPWWVIHGPVIAWGAVVLIPWFIALRAGVWLIPAGPPESAVSLSLPVTYRFNLFALFGLAVALAPLALIGRRPTEELSCFDQIDIMPKRAFFAIVTLLAAYVGSLPSLSRIWKLSGASGQNLYSNTGSSFLSLSLVVLAGIAIGYLARKQPLSWIGIGLYLVLMVVTLGSAHRYLVLILLLSYLILRRPFRTSRGSFVQRLVLLLTGVAAVWLVGFSGLGQLSVLRSGVPESTSSEYTERTLSSFDVMGSAEYLLESGGQPGQLHGSSYLALPDELIPHVLLGSRSAPPAVEIEQGVLGAKTGASAPLWIEGALNFGTLGDFLSMAVFAGLWSLILRRAISSRSRLGRVAAAIGPVWILLAYQALSRILIVATIDLFASIIIGLVLWNWMQIEQELPDSTALLRPTSDLAIREKSAAM